MIKEVIMDFNVNYYFENLDDKEDFFVKNIIKDSTNIIDLFDNFIVRFSPHERYFTVT